MDHDAIKVYQFRVVLERVCPMVWHRLLVGSDSSIADLHYTLQIAMGWQDDHLHCFLIHGKEYGIYQPGGISFSDNPVDLRLSDFCFRLGEYFFYEYDFTSSWKLRIRLEKILDRDPGKVYPTCTGGNRTVGTDESDVSVFELDSLTRQVGKVLSKFLDGEVLTERDCDKLRKFQSRWNQYKLDRKSINHRLEQYSAGDDEWRCE